MEILGKYDNVGTSSITCDKPFIFYSKRKFWTAVQIMNRKF